MYAPWTTETAEFYTWLWHESIQSGFPFSTSATLFSCMESTNTPSNISTPLNRKGTIETTLVKFIPFKEINLDIHYFWWFRNHAPVDMVNIPFLTGFCTSHVVLYIPDSFPRQPIQSTPAKVHCPYQATKRDRGKSIQRLVKFPHAQRTVASCVPKFGRGSHRTRRWRFVDPNFGKWMMVDDGVDFQKWTHFERDSDSPIEQTDPHCT